MALIDVFNLPFEAHLDSFNIGPNQFTGAEDYANRLGALQHLVDLSHEFSIRRNTGGHSVAGTVQTPEHEPCAMLPFESRTDEGERTPTALDDCLLLLSLFEKRDIFARHWARVDELIIADSRVFPGGGILRCSIPYAPSDHSDPMDRYNKGYTDGLNKIFHLIRSDNWRDTYRGGAFLLSVAHAMRPISLSTRFTLCWGVWGAPVRNTAKGNV